MGLRPYLLGCPARPSAGVYMWPKAQKPALLLSGLSRLSQRRPPLGHQAVGSGGGQAARKAPSLSSLKM